jgi:hypothetical protein
MQSIKGATSWSELSSLFDVVLRSHYQRNFGEDQTKYWANSTEG